MLSKKELGKFRDAREELHKKDEPYRRAANSDFIIYLLTLMAVAIFIRTFIFEPVQCIGDIHVPHARGRGGDVHGKAHIYRFRAAARRYNNLPLPLSHGKVRQARHSHSG